MSDEEDDLIKDDDENDMETEDHFRDMEEELENTLNSTEEPTEDAVKPEEETPAGENATDMGGEEEATTTSTTSNTSTANASAIVTSGHVVHNRSAYDIPMSTGAKAGRVRDWDKPIEVEDQDALLGLSNAKNWPEATKFPPMSVVVVKGRFDENTTIPEAQNKGMFIWYARVVPKVGANPNDRNRLWHIPKKLAEGILSHMVNDETLRESSLVTYFQPYNDNAKPFPVAPNDWFKVPGIKPTNKQPRGAKRKADGAVTETGDGTVGETKKGDGIEKKQKEDDVKANSKIENKEKKKDQKESKESKDPKEFKATKNGSMLDFAARAPQNSGTASPSSEQPRVSEKKAVTQLSPKIERAFGRTSPKSQPRGSASPKVSESNKSQTKIDFTKTVPPSTGSRSAEAVVSAQMSPSAPPASSAMSPPSVMSPPPTEQVQPAHPDPSALSAPSASFNKSLQPAAHSESRETSVTTNIGPFVRCTKVSTEKGSNKTHFFWDGNDLWVCEMK